MRYTLKSKLCGSSEDSLSTIRFSNLQLWLKRSFLLCYLCLLFGVATGTSIAQSWHKDNEFGYAFQIPKGWTRKTDIPRPMLVYMGPVHAGFRVNMNVYVEEVGALSLADYVRMSKEAVSKTKGITIRYTNKRLLGGDSAYFFQSEVELEGKPKLINRQVLCVRNKRGYVMTFTGAPVSMKKYNAVFNKCLASFKWLTPNKAASPPLKGL